jgi:hypothetical protein
MAKKQDTRHLFQRGAVWWVQSNRHGERIIQSTGETDLEKARSERDRMLNATNLKDRKDRVAAVLAQVQSVDQQIAKIEDEAPALCILGAWTAYRDAPNRPDSDWVMRCR